MRPPVCPAGRVVALLLLFYEFMLGQGLNSHDGLEFIELKQEIITTELGAIIFFDIHIPENTFKLSLIRPSGETVYFTQYFDNDSEQEHIDDIRLQTYEILNDVNPTNHISEDELGKYNDIEMLDTSYYYRRQSANHTKCEMYSETICEGGFLSRKIKIGPLRQEHHGNWVLSAYFYENEKIVEAFRVITVEIIENVTIHPENSILKTGDTFKLSLGLIIPYLESCELIAPKTTDDRYYERDMTNLNKCGYVIHNVTSKDQGSWKITAVGKIVYTGNRYLYIIDNITL